MIKMSLNKINLRTFVLILMIVITALLRVAFTGKTLSPLANFTPIGAMALFGGCYFTDKWKAYLVPLGILLLSDVLLMQTVYKDFSHGFLYEGWGWIYASFALMVLIGNYIKRVNAKSVLLAAVAAALTHWIVSDFGVWLGGGTDITTGLPFTRDAHGLMMCYYLAIPFMKNMLIGNLLYGALLFGGFELLQRRYPRLQSTIHPI
jgi:hypothetical protein